MSNSRKPLSTPFPSTEERLKSIFEIAYEKPVYINEEFDIIRNNSSFDVIKKEFKKAGIDIQNMTFSEMHRILDKNLDYKLILEEYVENSFIIPMSYNRITFLKEHLLILQYYLYDYNKDKMPKYVKEIFKSNIDFLNGDHDKI